MLSLRLLTLLATSQFMSEQENSFQELEVMKDYDWTIKTSVLTEDFHHSHVKYLSETFIKKLREARKCQVNLASINENALNHY